MDHAVSSDLGTHIPERALSLDHTLGCAKGAHRDENLIAGPRYPLQHFFEVEIPRKLVEVDLTLSPHAPVSLGLVQHREVEAWLQLANYRVHLMPSTRSVILCMKSARHGDTAAFEVKSQALHRPEGMTMLALEYHRADAEMPAVPGVP